MSDKVFKYVKDVDKGPDFTGDRADYYLQKYVNRPEDAGNLEGFQKSLSDMGILAPQADMLNAAIYLAQGKFGEFGLSAAAIIPIIGDLKKGAKYINKAKSKGEKSHYIFRGLNLKEDAKLIRKKGNLIGGMAPQMIKGGQKGLTYASPNPAVSLNYTTGKGEGILLVYKIPENILKKLGHMPPNDVNNVVFKGEIPDEFLIKVFKSGELGGKSKLRNAVWDFAEKEFLNNYKTISKEYIGTQDMTNITNEVMKNISSKRIILNK